MGARPMRLALLPVLLLVACAPKPGASLSWAGTEPPPLPDLSVAAPFGTEPAEDLTAGDLAPFDGTLLDRRDVSYCIALRETLPHAVGALQDERLCRLNDRDEAVRVLEAQADLTRQARQAQWRTFTLGTGVGATVTAAVLVAIVAGVAR